MEDRQNYAPALPHLMVDDPGPTPSPRSSSSGPWLSPEAGLLGAEVRMQPMLCGLQRPPDCHHASGPSSASDHLVCLVTGVVYLVEDGAREPLTPGNSPTSLNIFPNRTIPELIRAVPHAAPVARSWPHLPHLDASCQLASTSPWAMAPPNLPWLYDSYSSAAD